MRSTIINWINETYDNVLICDGFDECIIGVASGCASPDRVIYDRDMVIDALVVSGMEADEAVEFFEFNIAGAYMGDNTPLFLERP